MNRVGAHPGFWLSAPAAVSDIAVTNGGRSDALRVSWRPAIGVVDSYLVRLQDRTRTLHTLAVSHSSPPECTFSSLVAGRLYTVVIVTRTGSLENATAVQTRTRECGGGRGGWGERRSAGLIRLCLSEPATVQNPTAVHSARDDFLKVAGVTHARVLPLRTTASDWFSRLLLRCTGATRLEIWTATWS